MEPTPKISQASIESKSSASDAVDSAPLTKGEGLFHPGWRIAWEHIIPVLVALVVLLASLATTLTKEESVLWTIVSFLLTQTLVFQVIASQGRESLQSALNAALHDRQEKMDKIVGLTKQQPETIRREVIETLRESLPAMDVSDTYLQIQRDDTALATIAEVVLQRARNDLTQILSKRQYTMRVVTPSEDYVDRWYRLMEELNLKKGNAEFMTMSNIVIWSNEYFGKTDYGVLQKRSSMNIRRIFVVPSYKQLKEDPGLKGHMYSVLREYFAKTHQADGETYRVETKIHVARDEQEYRDHFIRQNSHASNNFAIWSISNEAKLLLTVEYVEGKSKTDFKVASITFGQSSLGPGSLEIAGKEASFHRRWDEESPAVLWISDYLEGLDQHLAEDA